jgi:hypothetical protein
MPRPAKRVKREARCYLLSIPIELRLQIYNWALAECSDVTITVAEREANIFGSPDLTSTIKGLPPNYTPVIRNSYDPTLLRVGRPDVIPLPDLGDSNGAAVAVTTSIDSGYGSVSESMCSAGTSYSSDSGTISAQPAIPHLTSLSLLLANRQIHEEFSLHIKHPTACHSTLHVTYPYGLIVLQELYPAALRHCEKVCISGFYDASQSTAWGPARTSDGRRHTTSPRNKGPELPAITAETHVAATKALQRLTQTLLPRTAHPTFKSLTMRIFYPDEQRYGMLWGCDASPIVVALRNTAGGKFDMKVWRGRCGNGVVMKVEPNLGGRSVCTVWKKYSKERKAEGLAWSKFGDEQAWDEEVREEVDWFTQ